jgi:hypothetical protein
VATKGDGLLSRGKGGSVGREMVGNVSWGLDGWISWECMGSVTKLVGEVWLS